MKTSTVVTGLTAATLAAAQGRPADTSICDYYTTALLMDNTAENQATLLTLVVNTAVIGNYTQPNVGITVPGILAKGEFNGEEVNLIEYFDGTLLSSNRGGNSGVSINFLDDGGAVPLTMNMPANGTSSNQYKLLTHLYSYFGYLLGCTQFSNTTGMYSGSTNMGRVHQFMGLSEAEFGYFVTQVGLSAASFGVADADVTAVGMALNSTFGLRCSPPAAVPATAEPAPQAICQDDTCPLSPNATCAAYVMATEPMTATMMPTSPASGMPSASMSGSMTASASMPATYTGAAAAIVPAAGLGLAGLAAMLL